MKRDWQLTISPRAVARGLVVAVLVLTVLSALGKVAFHVLPDFVMRDWFIRTFDVDNEGNIPSLYSALTLAFCSLLILLIARDERERRGRFTGRWTAMGVIFVGLAFDEYLSLHEELDVRLDLSSITKYSWVVVGAAFVAVFVVAYLPLLANLPGRVQRLFLLAGALFTSGAVALELVGGHYVRFWGETSAAYHTITGIEELLEMTAIVVFTHTLLTYLAERRGGPLTLSLTAGQPAGERPVSEPGARAVSGPRANGRAANGRVSAPTADAAPPRDHSTVR